jgi:hypothetical protein
VMQGTLALWSVRCGHGRPRLAFPSYCANVSLPDEHRLLGRPDSAGLEPHEVHPSREFATTELLQEPATGPINRRFACFPATDLLRPQTGKGPKEPEKTRLAGMAGDGLTSSLVQESLR